jgi:hypothetical protein
VTFTPSHRPGSPGGQSSATGRTAVFSTTASTTGPAPIPALTVGELFRAARRFTETLASPTEQTEPQLVQHLRLFWIAGTVQGDKMRPSLNFVEFAYFMVRLALSMYKRRASLRVNTKGQSPDLQRPRGLLGAVIALEAHPTMAVIAVRQFLKCRLRPFAAGLGAISLARLQRFGVRPGDVEEQDARLGQLTNSIVKANRDQLVAIFTHYGERDPDERSPRRVSLGATNELRMTNLKIFQATSDATTTPQTVQLASASSSSTGVSGRLSLQHLLRFARDFKLMPEILSLEELAALYRLLQCVEWCWWSSILEPPRVAPSGAWPANLDMVKLMTTQASGVPMPTRPSQLALSFE